MKYIDMTDEQLSKKGNNPLSDDLRWLVQAYRGLDKLYAIMTPEQLRTLYRTAKTQGEKRLIAYWGKKKTGKL